MKLVPYILIICLCACMIIMCKQQRRPEQESLQERMANISFHADSIQSIKTDSIVRLNKAIILESAKRDSISNVKISELSKENNRLRSIVRHLPVVRIDSSGQVVNGVPAKEYNALIESGNICDSLIAEQNKRILEKELTITKLEETNDAQAKELSTKEKSLNDFVKLSADEKREKEKSKKLNRLIPKIAIVCSAAGAALSLIILNSIK